MENPETKTHLLAHARRDDDALTHAREKHLKKRIDSFFPRRVTRASSYISSTFCPKICHSCFSSKSDRWNFCVSVLSDGPIFEVEVVPLRVWESFQPASAAVGERRELPAALTTNPLAYAALVLEVAPERRVARPFELGGDTASLVE